MSFTTSTRSIAALLLVVLVGLPVGRAVCARECAGVVAASQATGQRSEHCHKSPGATSAVSSVAPDWCTVFGARELATRDRAITSIVAPELMPAPESTHAGGALRESRTARLVQRLPQVERSPRQLLSLRI